jgi:hypothetical protein
MENDAGGACTDDDDGAANDGESYMFVPPFTPPQFVDVEEEMCSKDRAHSIREGATGIQRHITYPTRAGRRLRGGGFVVC